jgi:ubiquinone biosynthesis protein COQ4
MFTKLMSGPADELEASKIDYGASFITRLRHGLAAGIRLAVDPDDTQQVFLLARAVDREGLPRMRDALLEHAAGRQLLEERPAIDRSSVDFAGLRALPAHTLGGAYVRMLDAQGLDPDIFQRPPGLPDDLAYVAQRARQTHDLWHVLTGLDTSVPSEIALQAFTYGQLKLRLSLLIAIFGVLLFSVRHPQTLSLARRWYERGRRASFLLAVRWEDLWSEPLATVRTKVGLPV